MFHSPLYCKVQLLENYRVYAVQRKIILWQAVPGKLVDHVLQRSCLRLTGG